MTDKVQKIKDWISKEQDGLMDAQGNFEYPEHEGAYHILCNLDAYIDSLQENPVSNIWHDASEKSNKAEDVVIINPSDNTGEILTGCVKVYQGRIWAYTSVLLNLDNPCKIGKNLQEEPVSDDLEEEIDNYVKRNGYDGLDSIEEIKYIAQYFAKWQKLQDMGITNKAQDVVADVLSSADNPLDAYATEMAFMMLPATLKESYHQTNRDRICDAVRLGAKWQKEHLCKPADGEDLSEYEREVVVFIQDFPNDAGIMKVAIAHRPDPKGWDGKSITTGKVEHYTPKTYGKGGWNIPNVVLWLDLDIPKLKED